MLLKQHAEDSDVVELPENTITAAREGDAALLMEIVPALRVFGYRQEWYKSNVVRVDVRPSYRDPDMWRENCAQESKTSKKLEGWPNFQEFFK